MCSLTIDSRLRRIAAVGGIAATLYVDGHAEVERGRRVGESPDRDVIHPRGGNLGDVVERDSAGRLELRTVGRATSGRDGLLKLRRAHVVEEQAVRTGLGSLPDLV